MTRTRHPPFGGGPDRAMSPPNETSTPQPAARRAASAARSAASAFAVAPRSRRTPRARRIVPASASSLIVRQPGTGTIWIRRRLGGADQRVVAVVSERHQRLADGGIDVAVGQPRRAQRRRDRLDQQRADGDGLAVGGVDHRQLGVVAEARAGEVERLDDLGDRRSGGRHPPQVSDPDYRCASKRLKARMLLATRHLISRSAQEPPETAGPPPPPDESDGAGEDCGAGLDCAVLGEGCGAWPGTADRGRPGWRPPAAPALIARPAGPSRSSTAEWRVDERPCATSATNTAKPAVSAALEPITQRRM